MTNKELTKPCTSCLEIKSISSFYKSKTGKFGVDSKCKICINKIHQEYKTKNIHNIKKYGKEYNNREEVKIRVSNYLKNPEIKEKRKKTIKEWRNNNSDKIENYKLKKYQLTHEEYQKILKDQDELCSICKKHFTLFKRKLSVDHDHKTGKVRGLLCDGCNHGLGKFLDNIDYLLNAANYLAAGRNITRKDNNLELLCILRSLIEKHEDSRFSQLLLNFGFVKQERPAKPEARISWQDEFYLEGGQILERVKRRIKDVEHDES